MIHGNTSTRERDVPLPTPPAPSNPTRNLKRRRSLSDHNDAPNSHVDQIPTLEDDIPTPTIGQRLKEVEDRSVAHSRDEYEFARCLFARQEASSNGGSSPVTSTRAVTPTKLKEDKE